jgi:hypothetical protein
MCCFCHFRSLDFSLVLLEQASSLLAGHKAGRRAEMLTTSCCLVAVGFGDRLDDFSSPKARRILLYEGDFFKARNADNSKQNQRFTGKQLTLEQ